MHIQQVWLWLEHIFVQYSMFYVVNCTNVQSVNVLYFVVTFYCHSYLTNSNSF